ncbi:uncharacterized protein LOC112270757 [Brachypodium distachyon]|uniref:Uncharacterized protein n=1 Tax=Brachypodium distachyon TaxID=15368 RepID=A0A2K2DSS3_BRADI|nr:uncharacterized protein LOC112270757 [Brachypodium distachyon]PNT77325.1 hypothetical protein BRADI_1g61186v3 [Brachypodium distachyon]|eukprot:XP_024314616.1 uncharacterized protein LOC112270757 [Brachypodium distachyon]
MASGGGGGSSKGLAGKKRKAAGAGLGDVPSRREPRRGLGVAALESIRAQLETAENFYMFPSLPLTPPAAAPPPSLLPGVRFNPYVGDGAAARDCHPQYYSAQHYALACRYLQLQASSDHVAPRQNHQNNVVAVAAEQDRHRLRVQAQQGQHRQARKPQVAFVDLVDSDDDEDRQDAGEQLDLELKL